MKIFNIKDISILLVLLWMGIIFFLSSQPGLVSNNLSKKLSRGIVKVTDPNVENKKVLTRKYSILNSKSRDFAHIGVFFVLSIITIFTLRKRGIKPIIAYPVAFLFCIAYAGLDEFHQSFVPGRGAQWQDFGRDTLGVVIGFGVVVVVEIIYHCSLKRKKLS